MTRIQQQYAFLAECLKLSEIFRQALLPSSRRRENDAEHSWHLCLMAVVLAEHSNVPVDLSRVLKMLIIHDLVEIDAGDTYAYDTARMVGQHEREAKAADRIFGLLPADQGADLRAAWEEFEARQTPEAKFANALDRFQALLLNMKSGGGSWRSHGVSRADVLQRMEPVRLQLPQLWPMVVEVVERFGAAGVIR